MEGNNTKVIHRCDPPNIFTSKSFEDPKIMVCNSIMKLSASLAFELKHKNTPKHAPVQEGCKKARSGISLNNFLMNICQSRISGTTSPTSEVHGKVKKLQKHSRFQGQQRFGMRPLSAC